MSGGNTRCEQLAASCHLPYIYIVTLTAQYQSISININNLTLLVRHISLPFELMNVSHHLLVVVHLPNEQAQEAEKWYR
jgi:hypothetical protein